VWKENLKCTYLISIWLHNWSYLWFYLFNFIGGLEIWTFLFQCEVPGETVPAFSQNCLNTFVILSSYFSIHMYTFFKESSNSNVNLTYLSFPGQTSLSWLSRFNLSKLVCEKLETWFYHHSTNTQPWTNQNMNLLQGPRTGLTGFSCLHKFNLTKLVWEKVSIELQSSYKMNFLALGTGFDEQKY